MATFSLDNLKIFPYFGGNIKSKELSEQNLSATIRGLNLSNAGHRKYTQNVGVEPFHMYNGLTEGTIDKGVYSSDNKTLTVYVGGGNGTIYGYDIEITPDSGTLGIQKIMTVGSDTEHYYDKMEVGGSVYFQVSTVTTGSNRLETYKSNTSESAFYMYYRSKDGWNALTKEEKKKCLRIAQIQKIDGSEVTFTYTCNLGLSEGFECEDSSKYKINIDTNGITLYKYYLQDGASEYTKAGLFLKDANTEDPLSVGLITENITEKISLITKRALNSAYSAGLILQNNTDATAQAALGINNESRQAYLWIDNSDIEIKNTNQTGETINYTSGMTIGDSSTKIEYAKANDPSQGGTFELNSTSTKMFKYFTSDKTKYAQIILGNDDGSTDRLTLKSDNGNRQSYIKFTDGGVNLLSWDGSAANQPNYLYLNKNQTTIGKKLGDNSEISLRVGNIDDSKKMLLQSIIDNGRKSNLYFDDAGINLTSLGTDKHYTNLNMNSDQFKLYWTDDGTTSTVYDSSFVLNKDGCKISKIVNDEKNTYFSVEDGASDTTGRIEAYTESASTSGWLKKREKEFSHQFLMGGANATAMITSQMSKLTKPLIGGKYTKETFNFYNGGYLDEGLLSPDQYMQFRCYYQKEKSTDYGQTYSNQLYTINQIRADENCIYMNSAEKNYENDTYKSSGVYAYPYKILVDGPLNVNPGGSDDILFDETDKHINSEIRDSEAKIQNLSSIAVGKSSSATGLQDNIISISAKDYDEEQGIEHDEGIILVPGNKYYEGKQGGIIIDLCGQSKKNTSLYLRHYENNSYVMSKIDGKLTSTTDFIIEHSIDSEPIYWYDHATGTLTHKTIVWHYKKYSSKRVEANCVLDFTSDDDQVKFRSDLYSVSYNLQLGLATSLIPLAKRSEASIQCQVTQCNNMTLTSITTPSNSNNGFIDFRLYRPFVTSSGSQYEKCIVSFNVVYDPKDT